MYCCPELLCLVRFIYLHRPGGIEMLWVLAILALSIVPYSPAVEERVDLIEVNHFYREDGGHSFSQVIFWDWNGDRFQCRDWRMLPRAGVLRCAGGWRIAWHDGETLRIVRAATFRETWGQHDPEVNDREVLPLEHRRKLANHNP